MAPPNIPHTLKEDAKRRRKQAGVWLRSLRQDAGLSQRELAEAVQMPRDRFAFIAQIERGTSRVPADRFETWAKALRMEPRSFAIELMSYYDRVLYQLIFGQRSRVKTELAGGATGRGRKAARSGTNSRSA